MMLMRLTLIVLLMFLYGCCQKHDATRSTNNSLKKIWKSGESGVSYKYTAAKQLIKDGMSLQDVEDILGQYSGSCRYKDVTINEGVSVNSRHGVSYVFGDGRIDVMFRHTGGQVKEWEFDELILAGTMSDYPESDIVISQITNSPSKLPPNDKQP